MKLTRTAATLTILAATAALTTGVALDDAEAASADLNIAGVRLTGPDADGFHLENQTRLSADVYVSAFTDGETTVRASTRRGATLRVEATRQGLQVDATQTAPTKGKSDSQLRRDFAERGAGPVEQVIALGMDPASALERFEARDPGDIIDSWCVDISGEDGKIDSRGCVVRRLDQDNENGRYIADEMQQDAVANSSTWWNYSLTSAETYMIYEGEQEIVKYEPQSDIDLAGDCVDVNVGLQGSSGVQFGISKQICGDKHGPVQRPDDKEMTLGFGWSGGSDPGDDVAAIGTTLVRQDSLVGASSTLRNKVAWTWSW